MMCDRRFPMRSRRGRYRRPIRCCAWMRGCSGLPVRRRWWIGVIICGDANGLRKGPCVINGNRSKILEVGMQSSFVEVGFREKVGDEVVLVGDGLTVEEVGGEWGCTPHEVMVKLAGGGGR